MNGADSVPLDKYLDPFVPILQVRVLRHQEVE